MKGHRLETEKSPSGRYGYCQCGWSTGPCLSRIAVQEDHTAHITQRREERHNRLHADVFGKGLL